MKFRKRPVVVDVVQWSGENAAQILEFTDFSVVIALHEGNRVVEIATLEGVMRAQTGDWIIRGVAGEYYPCKPTIFEAIYEAMPDDFQDERDAPLPGGDAMTHELKTWPEFYEAILSGAKTFELRVGDRHYRAGDVLRLQEWRPDVQVYTGRALCRRVTYVFTGIGLEVGWVCMGLAPTNTTATWSVDEVMAERPCQPEYSRARVEALWGGREALTLLEILAFDIPASDRIWLACRERALPWAVREQWIAGMVARVAHCGLPAIEAWARQWLSGEEWSVAAAMGWPATAAAWAALAAGAPVAALSEYDQQGADLVALLRNLAEVTP